jgi:hypothetical protein
MRAAHDAASSSSTAYDVAVVAEAGAHDLRDVVHPSAGMVAIAGRRHASRRAPHLEDLHAGARAVAW